MVGAGKIAPNVTSIRYIPSNQTAASDGSNDWVGRGFDAGKAFAESVLANLTQLTDDDGNSGSLENDAAGEGNDQVNPPAPYATI